MKNIFRKIKNNFLWEIPKIFRVNQNIVETGNKNKTAFFKSKSSLLVIESEIGIETMLGIVPDIIGKEKNF